MTTQMKDTVLFSAEEFTLAEEKGKGLFEPRKHGLSPVMMSTACHRGYVCTYDVAENSLRLYRLLIRLHSPGAAEPSKECTAPVLFGKTPSYSERFNCCEYRGLNAPISFTGTLRLAAHFIRGVDMPFIGHPPIWMFRDVRELQFEKGALVQATDRSMEMAQRRKNQGRLPSEGRGARDGSGLIRWVARLLNRQD